MSTYIEPNAVLSPQVSISNLRAICDRGEWEHSVALLDWDHKPRVGIRWNGGTQPGEKTPRPGNPQSRGLPTWFVLPEEFNAAILQALLTGNMIGGGSIDAKEAEAQIRKELTASKDGVADRPIRSDLEAAVLAVIKKLKATGEI